MVQAKGMPERPFLISALKEMARMKLSFRMKPKHRDVQTPGFEQRMQSYHVRFIVRFPSPENKQKTKLPQTRQTDRKEHYFYTKAIKPFYYKQDT